MNELKPCPFCGEKVRPWDNSNATVVNVIECTKCKVRFVFPCSIIADITKDNYIKIFNQRNGVINNDRSTNQGL